MVERLHAADFLRGVAALIVVFWHYKFFFAATPASVMLYPFYNNGQIAVDLFFVISGFILMHVYHDKIYKYSEFREYMIKRVARLYPLHVISLMITALLFIGFYLNKGVYGFVYLKNDTYHFFLNLFLLQYVGLQSGYSFNAPSWTLSGEFWVNLLFAVFLVSARRALPVVSIGLILVSTFLLVFVNGAWLSGDRLGGWLEAILVRTTAGFFAGVSTYLLWQCSRSIRSDLPFCVGFVLFVGLMSYPATGRDLVYVEAAIAVIISPLLVYGAAVSPRAERLSGTAPGRWLGGVSFSIYMWHFPLAAFLVLLGAATWPQFLLMPSYLGLVLLVSTLSWICIEVPARAWLVGHFARRGR